MVVELTRFKVKQGKTETVDEWLHFLKDNMTEVLVTLDGEKMYVETIFREFLNGEEYLYWYSIQGDGGTELQESNHWVDQKHIAYWEECIDDSFPPVNLKTEVVMIPDEISDKMDF